jgi:copper(I)-binding protein
MFVKVFFMVVLSAVQLCCAKPIITEVKPEESSVAYNGDSSAAGIEVTDVWVRPGDAGRNTAVYLKIKTSMPGLRLIKAQSTASKKTEIHTHLNEDGVMKMRQVESLDCAVDDETCLKPGGDHIMLMGLTDDLRDDGSSTVPVILTFSDGSRVSINAPVKKPE